MRTYPIMLDLRGRLAVVVGGGPVGLRKARGLVEAGARVKLVAERIDAESDPPGVAVARETYGPAALAGAFVVFACTDDGPLNARIAADARRIGALVNVADRPDECDFYLPAVVGDGEVVVAIGTGGSSPALAAWLKRRLAGALPPRIGELAAVLEELRGELREAVDDVDARGRIMKRLVSDETCEAFLSGGCLGVRARFLRLIDDEEEETCPPRKPNS